MGSSILSRGIPLAGLLRGNNGQAALSSLEKAQGGELEGVGSSVSLGPAPFSEWGPVVSSGLHSVPGNVLTLPVLLSTLVLCGGPQSQSSLERLASLHAPQGQPGCQGPGEDSLSALCFLLCGVLLAARGGSVLSTQMLCGVSSGDPSPGRSMQLEALRGFHTPPEFPHRHDLNVFSC